MVKQDHPDLNVRRQCSLLSLARSGLYYQPRGESAENLKFMEIIDRQFLETPWYGSRQMARHMQRDGHQCGRHRVRRLMRLMRLIPVYQEPKTSKKHPAHKVYPYLLKDLPISKPNQVWCTDISYIPMRRGFLYLVAIMDWHSRKVLISRLSNSIDVGFCVEALEEALARQPDDRKAVAVTQIRMRLPERFRDRLGSPQGDRRLDQILQRGTPALIAWAADAG